MNSYQNPSPLDKNIFWIVFPIVILTAIFAGVMSSSLLVGGICVCGAVLVGVSLYFHKQWMDRNIGILEESDRYASRLMQVFDDAFIIYTTEFVITHFNPAAEKLFALRAEEILRKKISPQQVQDPRLARLAQVIFPSLAPVMIPEAASAPDTEVLKLLFQDPELTLKVLTTPIRENGEVRAFIKVIRDKTAEASIIKSKDEFITVASHQLRTPLTEVSWGLESLVADAALSPESHQTAETTLAAVRAVVKMAEDLLNIAKIEEGRYGYEFAPINIEEFIGAILEQALPAVKHAGLTLYFERSKTPLPAVIGDSKKLTIALTNLIENAVKYNAKGGQVTVKTELVAGAPFVRVSVKDTGIGISAEDQKKLFSKFFRAENAVKLQTRGSGFGLYITRNIVRAHGGDIEVHSEVNRGTVISLTLPTDSKLVPKKEVPMA